MERRHGQGPGLGVGSGGIESDEATGSRRTVIRCLESGRGCGEPGHARGDVLAARHGDGERLEIGTQLGSGLGEAGENPGQYRSEHRIVRTVVVGRGDDPRDGGRQRLHRRLGGLRLGIRGDDTGQTPQLRGQLVIKEIEDTLLGGEDIADEFCRET